MPDRNSSSPSRLAVRRQRNELPLYRRALGASRLVAYGMHDVIERFSGRLANARMRIGEEFSQLGNYLRAHLARAAPCRIAGFRVIAANGIEEFLGFGTHRVLLSTDARAASRPAQQPVGFVVVQNALV